METLSEPMERVGPANSNYARRHDNDNQALIKAYKYLKQDILIRVETSVRITFSFTFISNKTKMTKLTNVMSLAANI